MKMKLTKNTRVVLLVVGLVVYALLGYMMLVKRQAAKATKIEAQTVQVEAQIAEARIASRRVVKVEPVKIADLFRMSKAMPDTNDMPGVLLELNRVARDSGIEFTSITPVETAPAEGFSTLPIDLDFEGNFYDLTDFLYRTRTLVSVRDTALDARGRLFNVQTLDFTEGKDHFPQIHAHLRIEAYVYGAGAASAGAAPPATTPPPADPAAPVTPPATTGETVPPPTPPSGESATAMGATP